MSVAESVLSVLLIVLRACVGFAMIYSGVELIRGEGLLSGSQFDSVMTGLFVIVIGLYCIFSYLLRKLIDWGDHR